MKQTRSVLLLATVIFAVAALAETIKGAAAANEEERQQSAQSAPTLVSTVDSEISTVEKQIVDVAEAMPEDKFNFSPESLNIPGGEYKGVRTFAVQVKHVAASNYAIWSPLTGDKLPDGLGAGTALRI